VCPVDSEPVSGRVGFETGDTGYDDDWTATVMSVLPDDPDTLVGTAAEENPEEVMPD